MQQISFQQITIDRLPISFAGTKKTTVAVLRLDRMHPFISGNKWFKLRFYLDEAIALKKTTLLTFGGAWSNHIIATAAACQQKGLNCIGIIRGEEPSRFPKTLQHAEELGMQLHFISREDYAEKKIPADFINDDTYIINEGGSGKTGVRGAATIAEYFIPDEFTDIICAVGTGTMMTGLLNAVPPTVNVTGISVMKNNFELENSVKSLQTDPSVPFTIFHDYHFGGYAKHSPVLIDFMNEFFSQTRIPSDFVYTAKLFYAVSDLLKKKHFREGSRLLVIHSGGLQGNASLTKGTLIF